MKRAPAPGADAVARAFTGIHRAMGLILTGREVGAAEGERLGFVTEVVAHDRLQARALELANAVLECSPDSIRASKVSHRGRTWAGSVWQASLMGASAAGCWGGFGMGRRPGASKWCWRAWQRPT